jgi:hypothetical protein
MKFSTTKEGEILSFSVTFINWSNSISI